MAKEKKIPPIKLTAEQKSDAIEQIRYYFLTERDEEMGNLGAEMLLDFITEKIGKHYYNQGITEAQRFVSEKTEDLFGLLIY